jgi:putative heme-binding domain-containing protein
MPWIRSTYYLNFALLVLCLAGWMSWEALAKDADSSCSPTWIWQHEVPGKHYICFRKEFVIEDECSKAILHATADNHCEVFINGRSIVKSDQWEKVASADALSHLKKGTNLISVIARNEGGAAGLIVSLQVEMRDGKTLCVSSDDSWKVTAKPISPWQQVGFDDSQWESAKVLGELGDGKLPWSKHIHQGSFGKPIKDGTTRPFLPSIAKHAQVPEGFKIETIFEVPKSMGSWVSLTTDPQGRLIASDQGDKGLFLITPGNSSMPTVVERLPVNLSSAQGLLWAFDSLYAVVNGGSKSGLYRLRDTDADGKVDSEELCMAISGGGEHGPHAVILSPDGKSLFVAAGNHTKLPDGIRGSRIPQNWNEDHLLPRRWDANGHAAGILAPGGWICNVDPSGKDWSVFSMGYRNQYDIAFNLDGELFSYDADMEWDFGSPWYRPTRVCHATSGSEFGWRSGTGKWPTYYEDSLPPAVDIGPGSPTGIVFGQGAQFPARYQKSLFILDWTYSTIYSVELTPEGASYRGNKADFVTGSPLPVTDAIFGNDGAFYFTAGGRGTESSLYRVSYVGKESTAPVTTGDSDGREARALRQQLEAWHGNVGGDINVMLKHLSHADRFIRYAARIALESQPVAQWHDQAYSLKDPKGIINAMLAIARQGNTSDVNKIVETLMQLDLVTLSRGDQLTWLRTLEVAFARHGEPSGPWRDKLTAKLDSLFPTQVYELNAELVQLLVYLQSPTVVSKSIKLMGELGPEPIPDWGDLVARNARYGGTVGKMLSDMPPVRAIHLAFVLRNAKIGWSIDDRRKYFGFFIDAAKHPGGNSYAKFLMQFRDDAIATCTPAEQILLASLTSASLVSAPVQSTPPKGPGRVWTKEEALTTIGENSEKRDFKQGRNLYHATSCSKCHRLGGEGGAIGPDLSTAAKKFSISDMLDAIIEPSKAISDQYGSHQIRTDEGTVLVGRVVEIGDEIYVYKADTDAKPVILKKSQIDELVPSKVSQMPVGLIDTLNPEELQDLLAYLMAGGDSRAKVYK